jgi:aspartyl/asparaginyl-tRNA synthetase
MNNYAEKIENMIDYHKVINKLRTFFTLKGGIETFPQHLQTILAACEDPQTITMYNFSKTDFPMIQTNQMNLENIILLNPQLESVYCSTTSYRDEPNPIPGRHEKSFQMFEFEKKGDVTDLLNLLKELLVYLGFNKEKFVEYDYDELCEKYDTPILHAEHETLMYKEFGPVVFIKNFPERTSPFWNMNFSGNYNKGEKLYDKIDCILCGQETIGSASRSCDVDEMRNNFNTISGGEYAEILYNKFGKERVDEELDYFLSLNMIKRFGAGCGVQRLYRAMVLEKLL